MHRPVSRLRRLFLNPSWKHRAHIEAHSKYTCHTCTPRDYFSASERSRESTVFGRAPARQLEPALNGGGSMLKFSGGITRGNTAFAGWGQDRVRSGQKTARWKWKSEQQERCAPASVVWSSFLRRRIRSKRERRGLDVHRRLGWPRIGVALSKNGPHRAKGSRGAPASPPDSQRRHNSNRTNAIYRRTFQTWLLSDALEGHPFLWTLHLAFTARSVFYSSSSSLERVQTKDPKVYLERSCKGLVAPSGDSDSRILVIFRE